MAWEPSPGNKLKPLKRPYSNHLLLLACALAPLHPWTEMHDMTNHHRPGRLVQPTPFD